MMALEGGSVGFQIGGQATDFVLLVMNDRGANGILSSKVKLGAEPKSGKLSPFVFSYAIHSSHSGLRLSYTSGEDTYPVGAGTGALSTISLHSSNSADATALRFFPQTCRR